jgi:hypothetical protein
MWCLTGKSYHSQTKTFKESAKAMGECQTVNLMDADEPIWQECSFKMFPHKP